VSEEDAMPATNASAHAPVQTQRGNLVIIEFRKRSEAGSFGTRSATGNSLSTWSNERKMPASLACLQRTAPVCPPDMTLLLQSDAAD
jgi:hypothetical protein